MGKSKPQSQGAASRSGHGSRATLGSRAEKSAPKPWHRTTFTVSLVSLAGALLALTLAQMVSEHIHAYGGLEFYLNLLGLGSSTSDDFEAQDGHGAFGALGLGPEGGNSAEAEKAAFDAADAFALGNTEYNNGRFNAAREHFEDAVRFAPTHSFAWANLGNVQRELRDPDGAVLSHRTAVQLLPTRARHWYNLGVSLYSSRVNLPEAVEAFETALKLNDGMANAHYNLGVAMAEMGHKSEARQRYQIAASLEPNTMVGYGARCNLCNLVAASEGLGASARCFRELLADAPDYERALVNLAGTLQSLADAGPAVLRNENAKAAAEAAVAAEAQVLADGTSAIADGTSALADGTSSGASSSARGGKRREEGGSSAIYEEGGNEGPESAAAAVAAARAAAVAAAAGTGAVTARSLQKEARRLYKQALEVNPRNPIANHALTALETTLTSSNRRSNSTSTSTSSSSSGGGSSSSGSKSNSSNSGRVRAVPSEASAEYLGALFDSYALDFDASLASLGYQAPKLLATAVANVLAESRKIQSSSSSSYQETSNVPFSLAVDLGCGTGLCGSWIRSHASRLVGVDLSARMLELAAARTLDTATAKHHQTNEPVYSEVVHGDIGAALRDLSPKSVDLIVAADVLCYLGDLKRIFSAASSALSPNGYFAFTVEAWLDATSPSSSQPQSPSLREATSSNTATAAAAAAGSATATTATTTTTPAASAGMGWRMNVSGRYEHRKAHLEELAALHGLEVVSYEQVVARRRHADVDAEPVRAHLFVLTPSSVE